MAKRILKTTEEVAEILNVSAITVQRMAANNEIPARKVAGRWRFDSSELDTWLNTNLSGSSNASANTTTEDESEIVTQLKRVGDRLDDINQNIRRVGMEMKKRKVKNAKRNK